MPPRITGPAGSPLIARLVLTTLAIALLCVVTWGGPMYGADNTSKAQKSPPAVITGPHQPSLSLTPAIIVVHARPGQSTTQTLTVSNQTGGLFSFELKSYDVVVNDGKRAFIPAGETAGGIAQTLVFSPRSLTLAAGQTAAVHVTVTVPEDARVRAVVAMFEGQTQVSVQNGVGVIGSLGALITFTLSNQFQVEGEPLGLINTTASDNLSLSERLTNKGSEPVVPKGTLAILGANGALVGKVPISPQRLLPGEQLDFKVAYPTALKPGKYRALVSLKHEGGSLTRSLDFVLP